MNDSADIQIAADRLGQALQYLEQVVGPMAARITQLEQELKEAQSFETDRAELAQKLDDSTAREADFQAREDALQSRLDELQTREVEFGNRESEFAQLASETREELDRVIRQVKEAIASA